MSWPPLRPPLSLTRRSLERHSAGIFAWQTQSSVTVDPAAENRPELLFVTIKLKVCDASAGPALYSRSPWQSLATGICICSNICALKEARWIIYRSNRERK